jgi:hypothetical protein
VYIGINKSREGEQAREEAVVRPRAKAEIAAESEIRFHSVE